MSTKGNLADKIPTAKLKPSYVDKLYSARLYVPSLANNTKILIPWEASNYKGYEIAYADIKNMKTRLVNWRNNNKGKDPSYVNVLPPKSSNNSKKGKYLTAFENVFGTVKDGKTAIEKIRSKGYAYYTNAYELYKGTANQGNVLNNLTRLKKGISLNCCDYVATLCVVLNEMGYTTEPVQIQCTNVTHLIFRVKGKEFGTSWQWVDPAAMADKNSSYCATGKVCWCASNSKPKKIVSYAPKWFINMYVNDKLV